MIVEPELALLTEQLDAVRQRARRVAEGLDEKAFNWRSRPGMWSIAQCLEHLNVSARLFFVVIDRGIERGARGAGPFRYGFLERWFLRTMEPPVKTRFRAPKHFQPPPDASPAPALAAFEHNQEEMAERIRRADGLHLSRVKVSSPVSKLIKYSLGIALQVMVAHERRHLWQAEQVRAHPEFPQPMRDESESRTAGPKAR